MKYFLSVKGADTYNDTFLDLAEFTIHADHKLKTLEDGPVKTKKAKTSRVAT